MDFLIFQKDLPTAHLRGKVSFPGMNTHTTCLQEDYLQHYSW